MITYHNSSPEINEALKHFFYKNPNVEALVLNWDDWNSVNIHYRNDSIKLTLDDESEYRNWK